MDATCARVLIDEQLATSSPVCGAGQASDYQIQYASTRDKLRQRNLLTEYLTHQSYAPLPFGRLEWSGDVCVVL